LTGAATDLLWPRPGRRCVCVAGRQAAACESRMARQEGSPDFKDFDERLRRLREDARLPQDEQAEERAKPSIGGAGVQVGVELVAGVIGGALIGYWLDRWFDTWPVLFLVFFFLGAAAGMLNAYRYIRRISDVPEERKNG
jgi:ATP synthase protein I